MKLEGVGEVVLADTVGFVRDLPHELVAAFRSTLQEAREANLLLHVVDASDPLREERILQVREVLKSIGAGDIRELMVFNKIDLVVPQEAGARARVQLGEDGVAAQAWVSAVTGSGLDELRSSLARAVRPNQVRRTLHLRLPAASVRSDLYRRNAVRAERQCDDGSWQLDVELDATEIAKLLGAAGVALVNPNDTNHGREQRVA
jgi:GTP-binding protein HflX